LIPQALRELVANATIDTVTLQGYSAEYFSSVSNDEWYAVFYNDFGQGDFAADIFYDGTTGCLESFYIEYGNTGVSGGNSIAFFGGTQNCEDPEHTTANGTFTINGEGEYPYYYLTGIDPFDGLEWGVAPPPNLVFT
jgi:hypothetical protein